jgi:copper chaperone CopZ
MKFLVTDMVCIHCEKQIKQALKDIGVKKVKINLETKEVEVVLRKVSIKEVKAIITQIGYTYKEA